jgi:hypothetical protein
MKILRLAFIGLLAGFILSIFAGRSVWLEMRVNTGLLLPLTTSVAIIAGTFSNRQVPATVAIGMEIFLVFLLLQSYGCDPHALLIIPASTFKEGFFLHACDILTLNSILAAVFLLGNGVQFIFPESSRH